MEELDESADAEEFEGVHLAIQKGDTETVRHIVESHGEEKHFSFEETSALYKAFQCKQYEIISFLIHRGAKFVGYEDEKVYDFGIDKDRLNHLLFDYNKKSEKSSIHRLMSLSQSPQDLDGERLNAIISMYEHLFRCDVIKSLMKVLENVNFDIVFDFESDKINKVHRENFEEEEIYGLTLSNAMEIFIGAKDLLSADPKKRAKVHGVVAEELCHLALTTVFNNNAKPYKEEDSDLIQEFTGIVLGVKSLIAPSSPIESVIEDVFEYYHPYSRECELIARVPHVLGIYGEESGRRIFQDCSELDCLLNFYEDKVNPKCREYADSFLNTQSDRILKTLTGKVEFISFKEKNILPLREDFPSFVEYVVVEEGVSVISTNCLKLSALHIYHELKPVYGDHLERKCLFFGGECFEKKRKEILKALKCKLCDYFVLILDNKDLHHRRLLCEYLDEFQQITNEGMNVIIISNSQFLGPEFEKKAIEYNWDDLTDEFKDFRTSFIEYMFKGERKDIFIAKEIVPKLFSEVDIISIIGGDLMQVHDGADLHCQGYHRETYVEREFQTTIIDRNVFVRMPDDTAILIYGLDKWEFKKLSINDNRVQWLDGPDDEIKKGKTVFINDKWRPMKFKDFVEKTTVGNRICLQYDRGMFYFMNSRGTVYEHYSKKISLREEEIIDLLNSNKTLVISDNAGCGKSTVISSLMQRVKKKFYKSWVLKVDLNKFSMKDKGHDSEEDGRDDVFEDIFLLLGFRNGIEKCHLKKIGNQEDIFVFLDAFDEIPSKYKPKTLRMISFLRKNTDVRMMITTRMHHQQELEEVLNGFSLQLVPFDKILQVNCLQKLWKWKLKFPNGEGGQFPLKDKKAISGKIKSILNDLENEETNSERLGLILALKEIKLDESVGSIRMKIDGLEFNRLAHSILKNTVWDEATLAFMGIPLHLYMIGIIFFDGNYNVEISSDIFSIYAQFIHQKILIYVKEKHEVSHDGRVQRNAIEREKEDAYRVHINLANQLMDKGRIDCKMSENDFELHSALGFVFIKGAEVDFLHHTFAEFFKAESIRLHFNKDCFLRVLFEDKYSVVRRFISSALERQKFENLTKELFVDLNFLVDILLQFVDKFCDFCLYPYNVDLHRTRSYKVNSEAYTVAKIMKCLLNIIENTVDTNLVNMFFDNLRGKVLSLANGPLVGGCLTVKMLKTLFNRNFKANFNIIFGVVRYNSNPSDVIDILMECISIQTAAKYDTDEYAKAKYLRKLLMTEGLKRRCLLYWAICNEQVEIFANILKYSKDILGEELFTNAIVRSKEYIEAMEIFITCFFSRVRGLLKAIHAVFGNEMKTLFDMHLKFCILKKSLSIKGESRDPFEEVVNLLIECFGTESLKEVLVSNDSAGEYLIHSLVSTESDIIQRLKIISDLLSDKNKFKQFLKNKDRKLRNMYHIAARNKYINFAAVLRVDNLGEDEVKEMLMSANEEGENVLHLLFRNNSPETLIENLNLIKDTLADKELYKEFLKRTDKELNNIFHFAAKNRSKINLSFIESHLLKSEIKDLLVERNINGSTCLHFGAKCYSKKLPVLMDYLHEMDRSRFEELIFAKNDEGNTFLHSFVEEINCFDDEDFMDIVNLTIKSLKEKVSSEVFNKLLGIRNRKGKTFPQIESESKEKKSECFETESKSNCTAL